MRAVPDRRSALLTIGLLLPMIVPGCARLRSITATSRSSSPDPAGSTVGQARSDDTYASRSKQGTAPEGERVAVAPAADQLPKAEVAPDEAGKTRPIAIRTPRIDETAPGATERASKPPDDSDKILVNLIAESRKSLDGMANYQVLMDRQERVGGALQPAETVVLSLRRDPLAVRIVWPEGPNKGREALYSAPPGDGMLHVNMPNSIVSRTSLPPTSPLVLRSSRHPITEAGYDSIVQRLEADLAEAAQGRLRYRGIETPEGLDRPCHKVERRNPEGETWLVYLDRKDALPVLVQGTSKTGDLLERYVFRDLKTAIPQLAEASAFDPDALWGPSRGLFGRMAKGAETVEATRR